MKPLMRSAALAAVLATTALATPLTALAQPAVAAAEPIRGTALNLSAYGEVRTAPDMATITLGVNTQGATAEAAMRANATAMNQVMIVAMNPMPAPAITGRRCVCFLPVMLAVMAESTRIHSKPSRNTSTAMLSSAAVGLVFGAVGSGLPPDVMPCQTNTPATMSAASRSKMRTARRA